MSLDGENEYVTLTEDVRISMTLHDILRLMKIQRKPQAELLPRM